MTDETNATGLLGGTFAAVETAPLETFIRGKDPLTVVGFGCLVAGFKWIDIRGVEDLGCA